jgi:hypothetical protein
MEYPTERRMKALARALVRLIEEELEIMNREDQLARGLQTCDVCHKKFGHYIGVTKYGKGHIVAHCDCMRSE